MKRLNKVFGLIVDFDNLKEAHVNASNMESVELKWIMSINAYWGWIKPLNNKGLWQPAREVLTNA